MLAHLIAAPFWWVTRWIFNWRKLLDERAAYREHRSYRHRLEPRLTNVPGTIIPIPRTPMQDVTIRHRMSQRRLFEQDPRAYMNLPLLPPGTRTSVQTIANQFGGMGSVLGARVRDDSAPPEDVPDE